MATEILDGVFQPGVLRVQKICEELVADAGKVVGGLVFAECGKHVDRAEDTQVVLPAIALPPVGERVDGMDLDVGWKLLLSGLPGLAVEDQVERSLIRMLFGEHEQSRGLSRSCPCVDPNDSPPGIQDGLLLACGFHELSSIKERSTPSEQSVGPYTADVMLAAAYSDLPDCMAKLY